MTCAANSEKNINLKNKMTMVLFLILVAVCLMIWFFHYLNTPTQTYHETQREVAGMSDDDLIETMKTESAKIEAFIQAGLVGDQQAIDAMNNGTYDGPLPEPRSDGGWLSIYDNLRILSIAGINHRQGIIRYRGRIESALVPEPKNEYDPDAIKVVAEDGHHLGYVPSHQTDFVRSLASDRFPLHCVSYISQKTDEVDGHEFFVGHIYIVKREQDQG